MTKTKIPFLIFCLLITGCSGGLKDKESAQEAVNALQSVDSAISVGTNMVDYRQALVPAKTEVDQYLAEDSDSEFSQSLSKAMTGHQVAANWWQCNLETQWMAQVSCRDAVLPSLFAVYPETETEVESTVVERQQEVGRMLDYKSEALNPDAILQYIWQQTSADTALAAELLQ